MVRTSTTKFSCFLKGAALLAVGLFANTSVIFAQAAPEVSDLKTCPGTSVSLADALQEQIPSGYNAQWWLTNNRLAGTQVANAAAVGGGTYYGFYVSADGNTVSSPSTVVVSYYQSGDQTIGQVDGNDFDWNYAGGNKPDESTVSTTITQPGTNYGFVFDIYTMDNSFNMEINGQQLATNEIQFQSSGTPGINVEFVDGDQYETNTSGQIYQMTGSAQAPLIRVKISPSGNVTLYGSKVSGGPLFELRPKAGVANAFTLNNIQWNTSSTNTVVVSQLVTGQTTMQGHGYGEDQVSTACPVLPLTATADNFSVVKGTGGSTASVIDNDRLDGVTPTTTTVSVEPSDPSSMPAGITLNPDGTVTVDPGVAAGNYTFAYKIYTNGDPTNFTTATVNIDVINTLPVRLSAFNVRKISTTALLSWTAASEQNTKGFAIERSANSSNWAQIGFVNSLSANGNSSSSLNYTFVDNTPLNGNNYYRLKQTDLNGNFSYSGVKSVSFGQSELSIYPNPTRSDINISGLAGNEVIKVYDFAGRLLLQKKAGSAVEKISLSSLAEGTYLISVTGNNGATQTFKAIKNR